MTEKATVEQKGPVPDKAAETPGPKNYSGNGWTCCQCKRITSCFKEKCFGCHHKICHQCKINH